MQIKNRYFLCKQSIKCSTHLNRQLGFYEFYDILNDKGLICFFHHTLSVQLDCVSIRVAQVIIWLNR